MWRILLGLFVVPLILLEAGVVGGFDITRWAALNFFLFPFVSVVAVACHEAGHALAAHAVGLHAPRIDVGIGRRLGRWRLGGTTININSFPVYGLTYVCGAADRGLRWRFWATIAAGPAASAVVLLLAMRWPTQLPLRDAIFPVQSYVSGPALREMFAFCNVLMLATNLLPIPFGRIAGLFQRDGVQLFVIPFRSHQSLRELLVTADILEADELSEVGNHKAAQRVRERAVEHMPTSWVARNSLAFGHLMLEQLPEARAMFLKLIEEKAPSKVMNWIARNNVAWVDYRLRSEELREEADEFSEAVLKRFKQAPWAMGTRGAVLLWKGQTREGIRLLERAFVTNSSPMARARNAACLAIGHAELENLQEAERWVERARENERDFRLLDEAEARLKSLRTQATA